MPAAIGACGTVVAAVAAVFAAGAIKDNSPQPSQNVILITATPAPTTPGSTPTLTPATTEERSNAIVEGSWEFRYTVLSNNCPFGDAEGHRIDYPLSILERYPDDGYIDEGEDAEILDQGVHLGYIELTYPEFEFSYPVNAFGYAGTALVHISFDDSESGHGFRKDSYDDGTGTGTTCAIVAEDH